MALRVQPARREYGYHSGLQNKFYHTEIAWLLGNVYNSNVRTHALPPTTRKLFLNIYISPLFLCSQSFLDNLVVVLFSSYLGKLSENSCVIILRSLPLTCICLHVSSHLCPALFCQSARSLVGPGLTLYCIDSIQLNGRCSSRC